MVSDPHLFIFPNPGVAAYFLFNPRPRTVMTIEISKEARKDAIESIQQYFHEKMEEKIGNLAADALLDYFLEELGPAIYNKAVADVQDRLQARVMEVDIEIHEDEFQYWRKPGRQKKGV